MTSMLDPGSVDLSLLQDRQVAVLGYDPVASAHALNLRDSGVDVRVGTAPDGRGAARAEMDGLAVASPDQAVAACDIVVVPSAASGHVEHDLATLQRLLDEHTEPGDMVLVTGADVVLEGHLTVPDGVDLALFRAVDGGERLRSEYLDGRGCPAVVAVERDGSGAAWATLTAYAAAMGALRSGAIVTTFAQDALASRFAEVAVHGAVQRLVEGSFDALVEAGVEPEVAYLATLHGLKARTDEVYAGGYSSQHGPGGHGQEGVPADRLLPDLRPRLGQLLEELRDGTRTRPSTHTEQAPAPTSRRAAAASAHPIEQVGRRVRSMMSWIRS